MTITVSCPSCSTSFPVDPAKIPEGGVRAQCSECPEIFGIDQPDDSGLELSFAEPIDSAVDPSAPVSVDEMEVLPEVQSPFGADAEPSAADHDFASIQMDAPAGDSVTEDEPADAAPVVAEEAPATPEEAPAPEEAAADGGGFQFGKRAPEDKAKSLARSLVSDLIAYNPDKHKEALAAGTLVQVFDEEIGKSWKEFKDQVDPDVISKGTFFNDALNELLANGENVFSVEG
jgi:predicted Zn finger-like uncharacterized protein